MIRPNLVEQRVASTGVDLYLVVVAVNRGSLAWTSE